MTIKEKYDCYSISDVLINMDIDPLRKPEITKKIYNRYGLSHYFDTKEMMDKDAEDFEKTLALILLQEA